MIIAAHLQAVTVPRCRTTSGVPHAIGHIHAISTMVTLLRYRDHSGFQIETQAYVRCLGLWYMSSQHWQRQSPNHPIYTYNCMISFRQTRNIIHLCCLPYITFVLTNANVLSIIMLRYCMQNTNQLWCICTMIIVLPKYLLVHVQWQPICHLSEKVYFFRAQDVLRKYAKISKVYFF